MKIDSKQIRIKLKAYYEKAFSYFIPIFVKEGLHSNFFSITVLVLCSICAILLFADGVGQAGLAGILAAASDIMGSMVAEKRDDKESRRALVDSITDLYSEIIFYTGIAVFFIQAEKAYFAIFAYLCLVGSLMTVFIMVRARQFGYDVAHGFIHRPERFAIISLGMFFGPYGLAVASILIAIVANYTASRMIWDIWFTD